MNAYLICSAILVIVYFLLALNVSMTRGRTKVGIGWITWVVVAVTVCRVLHALGMLMSADFNGPPHPLRAIGALGTYIGGLALGVALLMRALL